MKLLFLLRVARRAAHILLGKDAWIRVDLRVTDLATWGQHGNDWTVWTPVLKPGMRVLTGGVGVDCSFEQALAEKVSFDWVACDPTPGAIEWFHTHAGERPPGQLEPVGLWSENTRKRFTPPANPRHISHTVDDHGPGDAVPLVTVDELCRRVGWDHIDLLKLDIEGAEYAVLSQWVKTGPTVDQLLVECHHGMYGYRGRHTRVLSEQLRQAGFRLAHVSESGREQTWLHRRLIDD